MCPKTSKWSCPKMVSLYPVSKIPCPVPGAYLLNLVKKKKKKLSPGCPGQIFLKLVQQNQPRGTWGGKFVNQVQKNQPWRPGRGFLRLGTGTPFLNGAILRFWERFLWGAQTPMRILTGLDFRAESANQCSSKSHMQISALDANLVGLMEKAC